MTAIAERTGSSVTSRTSRTRLDRFQRRSASPPPCYRVAARGIVKRIERRSAARPAARATAVRTTTMPAARSRSVAGHPNRPPAPTNRDNRHSRHDEGCQAPRPADATRAFDRRGYRDRRQVDPPFDIGQWFGDRVQTNRPGLDRCPDGHRRRLRRSLGDDRPDQCVWINHRDRPRQGRRRRDRGEVQGLDTLSNHGFEPSPGCRQRLDAIGRGSRTRYRDAGGTRSSHIGRIDVAGRVGRRTGHPELDHRHGPVDVDHRRGG